MNDTSPFSTGSNHNHGLPPRDNNRRSSRRSPAARHRPSRRRPAQSSPGDAPLFGGGTAGGYQHPASPAPAPDTIPSFAPNTSTSNGVARRASPADPSPPSWTHSVPDSPMTTTSHPSWEARKCGAHDDYGTHDTSSNSYDSDRESPRRKRSKDQGAFTTIAGFERKRDKESFLQMVGNPTKCFKDVADSQDSARRQFLSNHDALVEFAKKEIEGSTLDVKTLEQHKSENAQTRGQEKQKRAKKHQVDQQRRETQYREAEDALEDEYRELDANNDCHYQKTVSELKVLKTHVETFSQKIQPVIKAMADSATEVPRQCVSDLDSADQIRFYLARLGGSVEHKSIHDIKTLLGFDDYASCYELSVTHAVSAIQALKKAKFESNTEFNALILKMKCGKYNV